MELVDSCRWSPGEAVGRGGSSDVVDTGLDFEYFAGRLYINRWDAYEIGEAAGLSKREVLAQAEAERDRLAGLVEELQEEIHRLGGLVEEGESLRRAIAYTLQHGVVANVKTGLIQLRHQPGQQKIDVTKSLWPVPEGASSNGAR